MKRNKRAITGTPFFVAVKHKKMTRTTNVVRVMSDTAAEFLRHQNEYFMSTDT